VGGVGFGSGSPLRMSFPIRLPPFLSPGKTVYPPIKGWKIVQNFQLTNSQNRLIATSSEGLGLCHGNSGKNR
jgi:hypothetical protein